MISTISLTLIEIPYIIMRRTPKRCVSCILTKHTPVVVMYAGCGLVMSGMWANCLSVIVGCVHASLSVYKGVGSNSGLIIAHAWCVKLVGRDGVTRNR